MEIFKKPEEAPAFDLKRDEKYWPDELDFTAPRVHTDSRFPGGRA